MKYKLREELRDKIAKAIADTIGHGMREKCERHADAVLAILDADGDGGAVSGVNPDDLYAQLMPFADPVCRYCDGRGVFYGNVCVCGCVMTKLQTTHPARSGVVSDEDVESAVSTLENYVDDNKGGSTSEMTAADWQTAMRAALEHFARRTP